jgi:hypothetical protein
MTNETRARIPRAVVVAAVALGVAGGSYGLAAAATGSGSTTGTTATSPSAPSAAAPWGGQRSDETPLTGDDLAKVTAAAEAKLPGGTIVRVETDADGNAAYEAHMTQADGTRATVYVNEQFEVVSVESR